jgi:hypothetical protein
MGVFADRAAAAGARFLETPRSSALKYATARASGWHEGCHTSSQEGNEMIKLTWLASWKAYSVRRDGRVIGLVRCSVPLPFRRVVEFI